MDANPNNPVTRIDIEKAGTGMLVRYWREGWNEDCPTPPDYDEIVEGEIYRLMMKYEDQGFTCEMCDSNHGRALRGKITRIDFVKLPDGWHIKKWPYGWTAKTQPMSDKVVPDAEDAIKWCEDNGWNVRRWPEGARAFKGEPKPVRDTNGIWAMRHRVEKDLARGNVGSNKMFFDFAFDW